MSTTIAAFYKFVHLGDLPTWRGRLLEHGRATGILGTILLAEEGINATVAGSPTAVDALLALLRQAPQLADLEAKFSHAAEPPFHRFKVRLKEEIVSFGVPAADPTELVGRYVPPQQWNALISDPDVLVIDTRNEYEYGVGTFHRATNPHTESFREFPRFAQEQLDPQQHKRIAMFCTGGIRCEKATAYMRLLGFEEVYHLQGGILKYLEEVPAEQSLWQGDCFVFDQRVTVQQDLSPGQYQLCFSCQRPLSPAETAAPEYEEGISCPHCYATLTPARRASLAERHKQIHLAAQQQRKHLGQ